MERDVEEENKRRKRKLIIPNPDWLDLPEPIATNIILEHLDIVDYIRFSAVCKKWQSIQKEHRIRYSPYPPPAPLPFPWLRCSCYLYKEYGMDIHFYLPNKQKSYYIPFYKTPIRVNASGYGYGWLLLSHESFSILNPITGVQIELPMIKSTFCAAYICSPPTDPDCTIMVLDFDDNVFLYPLNGNNVLIKTDYSMKSPCFPIFFHNKIYYVSYCKKLCIIDAFLPTPVEQMIEMDCSEICVDLDNEVFDLVDFLGDLVMVFAEIDEKREFHLYKADFSTNKWVRMESLGDHALFFSYRSIFFLPAVDIVGCKKNTIYYVGDLNDSGVAWSAFDLITKNWFDGPHMPPASNECHHSYPYCNWSWFLPTLDYNNIAKTNGPC